LRRSRQPGSIAPQGRAAGRPYTHMPPKNAPLISENRIIRLLQNRFQDASPFLKTGMGDDAAVIHPKKAQEYWLITADMLLENIDFRREWTKPRQLGYKSIAVNLSDLAAMGARPRFYTVSLALPPGTSERWILEFYRGMTELGSVHGAILIGGDLSRSESGIMVSIAAMGESIKRRILYRSGGKPGDVLYVTGVLGRSAAGFNLLKAGCTYSGSRPRREAVRAHRQPEPRCEAGMWLAQCGWVRCMMDLSDGLSMDLPRLCEAGGVGAEIDCSRLPVFKEALAWGCDPTALALNGGEDFELLFAVPASRVSMLEKNYPAKFPRITRIGAMTRYAGKVWMHDGGRNRRRLKELGFDHFHCNPSLDPIRFK
jgi:thiamine-monophosphate kinase